MIRPLVLAALVGAVLPQYAAAQTCSIETDAAALSLQAAYADLRRDLRKVTARADGQDLQTLDLPAARRAEVPARPEVPALPAGFDAEGRPTIDCASDDGSAAAAGLEGAVAETAAALAAFEDALAARGTAIAALAAAATAPPPAPPVAETPPVADLPAPAPVPPVAESVPEPPVAAAAPEAPEVAAVERAPMPDADVPSIFRRVLALPQTRAVPSAGTSEGGVALPTFGVLYVFDERAIDGISWLEVGGSLAGETAGWIRTEDSLPWSTMLVMQFAPRGLRSEVLFFENVTVLADMVDSAFHVTDAQDYYGRLREERRFLAEDPAHVADWDADLVAVEPETAVTFEDAPYILPILDYRVEFFDGDQETVLLRVAAVPAADGEVGARDTGSMAASADVAVQEGGELRLGMVFVMDTTASMQPFIERTYQTVETFYEAFGDFESARFANFGLVGFRDDVAASPEGVDYVTRVFQPLDVEADPALVLTNMRQMVAAQVPTRGFQEDGFAGIVAALRETDWTPFGSRIIVYVTDASARQGGDPLAAESDLTAQAVAEMARNAGVTIIPVHLVTQAGREAGDIGRAETQYRALAATGDGSEANYIAVDATDVAGYR